MTLWVVLILMVVAALAVVLFPQLRKRRRKLASRREYDVAVYADQLRELKTDVERGVLSADEETQARIEIERRVLHADAAQTIGGKKAGAPIFSAIGAGILLAFIPGFAVGIYLWQGSPDVAGQIAEIPPLPAAAPELGFAVEDMVARLRDAPDNLDGWLLLGRTYVTLGRHSEAVDAYRQAAALAPGDSSVHSRLGESMVMAAEGFVTPAARAIFEGALGVDGHDPAARYYLALANAQSGRLLEAFEGWRALARDAPADAPWLDDVRGRLAGLAGELGLDIDEAMEGVPAAPGTSQVARGPSQADIAAAAEMTPEERRTMIRGMVEGLAARLEENPNDPDGWLRLARSYDVLGESGRAAAARARAQTASAAPRGPGQDDIAAAAEMTPDERREMIRGMVEGLAARLEENPNDPDGWLRLARSYDVLGEPERAAEARARAQTASAAPRGPSQDDIDAAAEMAPEDRNAIIRNMVEGLAARLQASPNDAEGWLRLARSYDVLGEPDMARAALATAAGHLGDNPAIIARYAGALVQQAGAAAPVPEAAVELYRRVLAVEPGHANALYFVGLYDAQSGRTEAAVATWRKLLLSLDPASSAYAEIERLIDDIDPGR